jgi:hypothetical protein
MKKKLRRFAEMETFPNVIQPVFEDVFGRDFYLKGFGTGIAFTMRIRLSWSWVAVRVNIPPVWQSISRRKTISVWILKAHGSGEEPELHFLSNWKM